MGDAPRRQHFLLDIALERLAVDVGGGEDDVGDIAAVGAARRAVDIGDGGNDQPRAERVRDEDDLLDPLLLGQRFQEIAEIADVVVHVRLIDDIAQNLALRRSEEHTSELQSLMRISYAVFCLKKKNKKQSEHYAV